MVQTSQFLEEDSAGNWNTIPPVPADKLKNINCHMFVLYIIGRLSWEEMIDDSPVPDKTDFTFGDKVREISDLPFTLVESLDSLYAFADKSCEAGKAYIGQILDAQTNEMAHSFILQKDVAGTYTCFDKQGFKYPFSVHELGVILDFVNKDGEKSYQNQKWRFVPIEAV